MPRTQPWKVIPARQQKPGAQIGGMWVVLQVWPVSNHWTMGLMGPEGMKITAGYGQWEVTAVPREVGITQFTGRQNYEATLDLLYDGWIQRPLPPLLPNSFIGVPGLPTGVQWSPPNANPAGAAGGGLWIEGMIKDLESLANRQRGDSTPHTIRIYGGVPHPEIRWAINGLEWGDCIRDVQTGRRMRQQVTVSLLEYQQPWDLRRLPRPKPQPKKKRKAQQRRRQR